MEETLFALSKKSERVPLKQVYAAILAEAQKNKEEAKKYAQDFKAEITYQTLCAEISNFLYDAAAALENTEEINPTK